MLPSVHLHSYCTTPSKLDAKELIKFDTSTEDGVIGLQVLNVVDSISRPAVELSNVSIVCVACAMAETQPGLLV